MPDLSDEIARTEKKLSEAKKELRKSSGMLFGMLAKLCFSCAVMYLSIRHRHDMSGIVWAILFLATKGE